MTVTESGVRVRTRRAILDAASGVLADDPSASMADVATAAGVGRTTLHRYFPERAELVRALALHVHALSNAAIVRAEPECGAPAAALRRVIDGQLELGPIVLFVYSAPVEGDPAIREQLDLGDEAIVALLDRLAVDSIVPGWPRLVFWALLQAGFEAVRDGSPRTQVVDAIMAALTRGTIDPERI